VSKLQAAVEARCKEVIVPKENERDVQDVPEYIRDKVKIRCDSTIEDVLAAAIWGAEGPAAYWRHPLPRLCERLGIDRYELVIAAGCRWSE